MPSISRVTDSTFEKDVLHNELPVFVDFWASWCPPCKVVEPILEELAKECKGRLKIYKINVDQNPISAANFQIVGVPTFVLFREGDELQRRVGAQSKEQLRKLLSKVL